jgi:FkbM family methyltransferase
MKLAIDIGCNKGKVVDFFLNEGYDRVIAVDANIAVCNVVSKIFIDKPVTVLNYLMSNVNNELIDFYISNYDVISSASLDWIEHGRFTGKKKWNKKIQVNSITIDELITRYGMPEIVKVDVEGYEYTVMLGLTHAVPLVCFEWVEEKFDEAIKCVNHLKTLGYNDFAFTYRDNMSDLRKLTYEKWEDLEIHKKIISSRKYLWGMIWGKI